MAEVDRDLLTRYIQLHALKAGVDPALAVAVATQESSLNPGAVGDNGKSLGLFQLQRAAAIDAGIDPARRGEIALNVQGGVAYLKQKLQQSRGNVEQALSRYNRGTPDYRGIGDPRYVENVLEKMERGPAPQPGLLRRASRMLSPASAEAAEPSPAQRSPESLPPRDALEARTRDLLEARKALLLEERARLTGAPAAPAAPAAADTFPPLADQEAASTQKALTGQLPQGYSPSTGFAAPAPAPEASDPKAGYEVDVIPGSTRTAPAAPAAAPFDHRAFAAQELARLQQEETQRLSNWRLPAATGISAGSAMLGTAAGTLAAPLLAPIIGPAAVAMPLVGEMAGSYLGRQLNVGLGLEEPGTLGDVASVALPGLFGLRRTIQGFRAGAVPGGAVPRGAEPLAEAAQAHNVPLTYGEMANQPLAQRAETLLEQAPVVGTGRFRRGQQRALTQAAEHETTRRQAGMANVPWQGLAETRQAAQQGNRQAQQVVEAVERSGDDWSRIVQASGNLRAFRARQAANRLYGEVDRLAQPLGAVPPERTVQAVDTVLAELQGAVLPDQPVIQQLTQMREQLTTVPRTYRQMRQFDSDLGDIIRDYYRGSNAVVGSKGVGSFTRLRTALREDMDQFAQHSGVPELAAAQQRANRFYQRQVIPYEDAQLAKALRSDTPDEIYAAFIQRGHRDRAQKFYNALEPHGRAAVQYGMVAEALEKSVHPTTGNFSPARFAGEMERIQDARGVFFRGQEAWRLDGLARVMRAGERAGYFTENPPTGQRVIGAALLTGAGLAPATTAKVAGASAVLSWLLTSRAGSSLLLRAHRAVEDSMDMQHVLQALEAQGARVLATEAGEGLQDGTAVEVQPGRVMR